MFSPRERERGNRKTHVLAQPDVAQTDRDVRDSTIEMGRSLPSLFFPVSGARRAGRKMRPAGGNNRSPKKLSHKLVVTENGTGGETSVVEKLNGYSGDLAVQRQDPDAPIPGVELNTRLACVPSVGAARTNRQKEYRNSVPPRDVTGEAFQLDDAAVLTPAISGAASWLFLLGRWPRLILPGCRSRPLLELNFRPLLRIYP